MNQPYNRYQQASITTSNPMKLVLMLYDGAINFLKDSIEYLAKRDIKNKNIAITRAKDIIEELNNSLNTEVGGEFALHLRRLYFFMNRHLFQANLNNNTEAIREVIQLLSGLREAWQDAYNQQTAPSALPIHQIESQLYRQSGIRI
jgi:flagellar secretion chaperone FliS